MRRGGVADRLPREEGVARYAPATRAPMTSGIGGAGHSVPRGLFEENEGFMKQPGCNRRHFLAAAAALAPAWAAAARAETPADLTFASAGEAARAIRARAVSSVELTRHLLARIERYNPGINAIATLLAERALAQAQAADAALARGEWWGPFHGVPVTIKDTFEMAGVRSTAGVAALKDHVPPRDAAVVERLARAGAVIVGKGNVPPLAMDWQTTNELFGTTNNPWDLARTPGGSTGGDAAAIAAGLSYLAVGTDIGGSIRIPSHFCGVYGHKPSLNVVPNRGQIPPLPGVSEPPAELNVSGPLARSAADLRLALEVLGGPEGDAAKAYRWSLPPARGSRLADYRIGFVLDSPLCPLSSEAGAVLSRAVDALAKAGARLHQGWPAGVDPQQQYDTYRFLLFSYVAPFLGPYQQDSPDAASTAATSAAPPPSRSTAAASAGARATNAGPSAESGPTGATGPTGAAGPTSTAGEHDHQAIIARATAATYPQRRAASEQRMRARAGWQEYFQTHDLFLLPASFVPAFPHDTRPTNQRTLATSSGPRDYMDLLFWISFATFTGLPATVAPAGRTRGGLPVGLQILGPYLEDATPIDFAGRLADVTGGFEAPPQFR
jgi:amidase